MSPPRLEQVAPPPTPISFPAFEPKSIESNVVEHEMPEPPDAPPAPVDPPPPAPRESNDPFDDVDTPAFIRRERKLFN